MLRFACLVPIALAATPALAQPCEGTAGVGKSRVTVEATGVRDAQGDIVFAVYPDDKKRFLAKGAKVAGVRMPAKPGTVSACFWLAPGGYPFAVYHDANSDHHLNRILFVAREGYGLSNDVPVGLGWPPFDRVRTVIGPGSANVRIRLRYP